MIYELVVQIGEDGPEVPMAVGHDKHFNLELDFPIEPEQIAVRGFKVGSNPTVWFKYREVKSIEETYKLTHENS